MKKLSEENFLIYYQINLNLFSYGTYTNHNIRLELSKFQKFDFSLYDMNNTLFQRKWYTVINKRTFDQLPWNTPLKMLVNFNQKMCKTGKGEDVVFIESAW